MKFQWLFSWLFLRIVATFLLCLVGLSIEASIVNAQNDEKVISLAYSRNPQLKFSGVKTGQKFRKFDENFSENEDWVKNLSFNLENISGKPIVYLKVNINFPETRLTGPMMSYQVTFGQRPGSKHLQNKPLLLKTKEVIGIKLEESYDKLVKFINERQPLGTLGKIELEIGFIVFEDGTAWSAGSFMKQDPNDPNRYIPFEIEQPQ